MDPKERRARVAAYEAEVRQMTAEEERERRPRSTPHPPPASLAERIRELAGRIGTGRGLDACNADDLYALADAVAALERELAEARAEIYAMQRENTRLALGQPAVEANFKLLAQLREARAAVAAAQAQIDANRARRKP